MPDPIAYMTSQLDQTSAHFTEVIAAMSPGNRAVMDALFDVSLADFRETIETNRFAARMVRDLSALAWGQLCLAAFTRKQTTCSQCKGSGVTWDLACGTGRCNRCLGTGRTT